MTDSDDDRFYRAFEESFRGSQTETRGKLEAYRPLLETLIQHRPHARAIDLGCGRGEFLDFLSGLGFEAEGVDLDAGMLAAARARGFDVRLADATTSLRALPDASRDVVSGFHIVEHLSFQTLRDMTREALRVLAPGGVLIYETPNPENVNVGIHTFHMDPTHIKPLPPAFLRFLVSFEGARRAHVWRLQHDPRLPAKTAPSFRDLFFGVSPDYAVVGQKGGDEALETALDFAFEGHGGVDLYTLAARLDQSQARSSGDIQTTFATHQQNLATHGRTLAKLEPKLATLERRLDEALRQAQHRAEEG
jgi:SAM-dependent methyltransferase